MYLGEIKNRKGSYYKKLNKPILQQTSVLRKHLQFSSI